MGNKILFITAFPPNNNTAGQYYSLRLINDILNNGWQVDIIYFEYPNHIIDSQLQEHVIGCYKPTIKNSLRFPFWNPIFSKRYNEDTLLHIEEIKSNYEILYFDFSQTFMYAMEISHKCKILMCHDIICQKFTRQNKFLYGITYRNEKKLLHSQNAHIFTFSEKDCRIINLRYKLDSIPINFYLKEPSNTITNQSCDKYTFCLYGAWNRKENLEGLIWFAKNVLPHLNNHTKILIIGGGLKPHKLLQDKRITTLGFIEDPSTIITKCQALIAPLFKGAGVKVKVIDSLSTGTPVIGTEIALEGISANNQLLIKCTTAKEFITTINNWNYINYLTKNNYKQEFINQYNNNHFPDYLDKLQ